VGYLLDRRIRKLLRTRMNFSAESSTAPTPAIVTLNKTRQQEVRLRSLHALCHHLLPPPSLLIFSPWTYCFLLPALPYLIYPDPTLLSVVWRNDRYAFLPDRRSSIKQETSSELISTKPRRPFAAYLTNLSILRTSSKYKIPYQDSTTETNLTYTYCRMLFILIIRELEPYWKTRGVTFLEKCARLSTEGKNPSLRWKKTRKKNRSLVTRIPWSGIHPVILETFQKYFPRKIGWSAKKNSWCY